LPFNKYKVSYNHAEFQLNVHSHTFDTLLGAFSKLRKATINFVMTVSPSVRPSVRPSVSPHGTTRLPLDGFSSHFVSEYFSKSVEKIQKSLKSEKKKRILYMKVKINFRSYLA